MPLEHQKEKRGMLYYVPLGLSMLAIALAVISIGRGPRQPQSQTFLRQQSSLERTKEEKLLRVGYAGFPPYTIMDPNISDPNKRVSGFCVDMVNEIAKRQTPPWRVEWHKASWESLRGDLYSGKFDVLAEGVYQTVPRATEFLFTQPFSYFGVAVAVVRANDIRFENFEDLNREDVTISLPEGWTSTEYARDHLKKANLNVIPVGDDINVNFMDVLTGRADAALQDVPTVLQFVREHSDKVKALWLDNPPLRVAAGFATRIGDTDMIEFLNTCIRVLEADGTMDELDAKWNGMGEYERPSFKLGAGIQPTR